MVSVVGAILAGAGYLQSRGADVVQPASALLAIRISMAVLPTGITAAAMLALMFYHLDEARLNATRQIIPLG
jgi:Na+/melibiose symporter-like transporter